MDTPARSACVRDALNHWHKTQQSYIIHNNLKQFCASHSNVLSDVRHLASLRQLGSGIMSGDKLTSSAGSVTDTPQVSWKCESRSERN